jgi:hypothetical protein
VSKMIVYQYLVLDMRMSRRRPTPPDIDVKTRAPEFAVLPQGIFATSAALPVCVTRNCRAPQGPTRCSIQPFLTMLAIVVLPAG